MWFICEKKENEPFPILAFNPYIDFLNPCEILHKQNHVQSAPLLRQFPPLHQYATLRQYGNMPILLLDAKFHLYAKFHLVANFNRNANFHLDANFNPYANFHLHEILYSVRFFCKMTICFSKYRKICNSFIAYSHEIDDLKNLDQKIIFLYVPSDTSAGYLVAEKWFAARILSLENPSASVLAGLYFPFSLERGHSSDSVGWDVKIFFQNFQIIYFVRICNKKIRKISFTFEKR